MFVFSHLYLMEHWMQVQMPHLDRIHCLAIVYQIQANQEVKTVQIQYLAVMHQNLVIHLKWHQFIFNS